MKNSKWGKVACTLMIAMLLVVVAACSQDGNGEDNAGESVNRGNDGGTTNK